MLLQDPYAGHRDSFTGEPDGPLDEWTGWDFSLAVATQNIIDGTTDHGHLMWEIEADDVEAVAIHRIDKARQVIDMITQREGYKPEPGEYYRTKLKHPYYDPESGEVEKWQTRTEWIQQMIEEDRNL